MIFELRGVDFHNKGAELMLQAILEKVKSEFPTAQFVMTRRHGVSISQMRRAGIYTKLSFKKYGVDGEAVGACIPKFIRRACGFILGREVDVILEGSGFAYGDYFGAERAKNKMSKHMKTWKEKGIKVIMLPQAFGPFTNADLKQEMTTIIKYADLIFARDEYSYNYLKQIDSNRGEIFKKPDFTNILQGTVPASFEKNNSYIAIVPNNKLIESGVFNDRKIYLDILHKIVIQIRNKGFTPLFLIHEGEKDYLLASDVNRLFNLDVEIIREDDPLIIKGIIGNVRGLVTSRFHGLVSGLAQCVPSLCIGWSHKYKALLEDYNWSEGLITENILASEELLAAKIDLILEEESIKRITTTLKASSKVQKDLTFSMWDMVFKKVKQSI